MIKCSRKDCAPGDVYNTNFWNPTGCTQWEAAMAVWTWAKAKRKEVVERWCETGSLLRGFHRRFNGWLVWPNEDIEDVLEDVFDVLDPLSNLHRLHEEERFLACATNVLWFELMDVTVHLLRLCQGPTSL